MRLSYVFEKLCVSLIALIVLTVANCVNAGLIYHELDDAGITVGTAQHIPLGTTTIFGALDTNDGADVYDFFWGGGLFSAGTQGSDFDTMLSIFDESGSLLAFNDDFVAGQKVSFLSVDLSKGDYLMGITYYDNNYSGDIDGYTNTGIAGTYQIDLSASSEPQTVPEPATLTLFAIGLIGLGFHLYKSNKKISLSSSR